MGMLARVDGNLGGQCKEDLRWIAKFWERFAV